MKKLFSLILAVLMITICLIPLTASAAVSLSQGKDALYAIALEYPEDQLVLEIDQPADNMKVTLLGCPKPMPWKYRDGQLIIDTSGLKYSDLKSTAAWVFKMKNQ